MVFIRHSPLFFAIFVIFIATFFLFLSHLSYLLLIFLIIRTLVFHSYLFLFFY